MLPIRVSGAHRAARAAIKVAVMGVMERDGELRAKVAPNTFAKVLHAELDANVAPQTTVRTGECRGYLGLSHKFHHHTVNHPIGHTRTALRTPGACSSARCMASTTS